MPPCDAHSGSASPAIRHPAAAAWTLLLAGLAAAAGCGPVDAGRSSLAASKQLPDARSYALHIHSGLVDGCATAACHGRPAGLQLVAATQALPPDAAVAHPRELDEPYRSGYYTVLGYCRLDRPELSPLLLWGGGEQPAHPGGDALDDAQRAAVLDWLRDAGGDR